MDKIYFRSKRDWWLGMVILMPLLFVCLEVLSSGEMAGILIGLPLALLMSWFWWGTGYTFIGNDRLKITCGPVHGIIRIDSIVSVEPSHAPWSSAALSLDRLKLTSSQRGWNKVWYISPADKEGFLLELMHRNPKILV